MRAHQFVNEIESIGSLSGAKWLPADKFKRTKPIPGRDDLTYRVRHTSKMSGPTVFVYSHELDRIVGALETMAAKTFPIKDAVHVSTISVDPKFQGQGIAQFMYDIIVNKLKLPLVAGSSQTPESQRAWLTMAKKPDIDVTGYVVVGDTDINEKPQLIDKIMSLGGQNLGRYKTKWGYYHYFIFPLKFGRKRLNPMVLNKLSQIYGDDKYATGMYAVGTRR